MGTQTSSPVFASPLPVMSVKLSTGGFSATTSGAADYILKVTNAAGCEAIDTINVTLNPTPTAVDIRDTSLCLADLPVTLDATQDHGLVDGVFIA